MSRIKVQYEAGLTKVGQLLGSAVLLSKDKLSDRLDPEIKGVLTSNHIPPGLASTILQDGFGAWYSLVRLPFRPDATTVRCKVLVMVDLVAAEALAQMYENDEHSRVQECLSISPYNMLIPIQRWQVAKACYAWAHQDKEVPDCYLENADVNDHTVHLEFNSWFLDEWEDIPF